MIILASVSTILAITISAIVIHQKKQAQKVLVLVKK